MKMRMKVLAASVAALAGALVVSAPNAASAGTGNCARGYFCAWVDANYDGAGATWAGSDSIWPSFIWNEDSSWSNNGIQGPGVPAWVRVYSLNFQQGSQNLCIGPGQKISYNAGANDNGQSHGWYSGC
ncbi:peptidase inhibitor family I36 protein [Streptosporangium sp. NPDC051023]|uniref:peptidase inhibitor family I36 protein n=1 Tax=Streptosporangium sp. NPDC051023 TaxID=3155410 RepID=UPI00344FDD1E